MAAEYEPSGRGFLDVFVPIAEPPHADSLVDDPLFLGQCGDYPSCMATSAIAITAIVFTLIVLLIQLNANHRSSSSVGLDRIRYITKRCTLLSTLLMAGWIIPLMGQYHAYQLVQDLLLFNNSAVLIFAFTAVWYEFFVLNWYVNPFFLH